MIYTASPKPIRSYRFKANKEIASFPSDRGTTSHSSSIPTWKIYVKTVSLNSNFCSLQYLSNTFSVARRSCLCVCNRRRDSMWSSVVVAYASVLFDHLKSRPLVPTRNPSTHLFVAKLGHRPTVDSHTALTTLQKLDFRFGGFQTVASVIQ